MAFATQRWSDRTYKRNESASISFDVIGAADEEEALAACPFEKNSSHPLDARLRAENPDVSRPGFNLWKVTFNFSIPEGGEHEEKPGNPLDEQPRVKWDIGSTSEPIDRDIFDTVIANSAGSPFDPPPSRDFGTLQLTITRNEGTFDLDKSLAFQNKVNSNTFSVFVARGIRRIVRPGQMRCLAIKPTSDYAPDDPFVNVSYEFELREGKPTSGGLYDSHMIRILDAGLTGWYDDGGTPKKANFYIGNQADPQEPSDPVLLHGDGTPVNQEVRVGKQPMRSPISVGQPPSTVFITDTADATFLHYQIYRSISFNGLDL